MSGGGSSTSNKPPKQLRGAFDQLGQSTEDLTGLINRRPSYLSLKADSRVQGLNNMLAKYGSGGLDRGLLETTFATGGFTPFTADDQRAFSLARGLSGSDPALQEALGLYRSNSGIGALEGIDIGRNRTNATQALRDYNSDALQGLNFRALENYAPTALRNLDFDQLEATARGDFLDVANNPFLSDALANAQRQTTEAFQRDVQPALAAQFGGGFGLTGSSSINAQRRAAEDLSRSLSEQATSTYAGQYNIERALQEQAAAQLGQLGLGRATNLDSLRLDRAGQLGQLGLSRAQGIDANLLNRATALGDLGLGFTNAAIDRGSSLANAELAQAQGIAGVGEARRAQELQRIGLLNSIGAQQRQSAADFFGATQNRYDAQVNDQLARLQGISSIINGTPFGTQTQGGGGSRASGIVGGAATGAAAGAAFGPYGALIGGVGGGLLGAF